MLKQIKTTYQIATSIKETATSMLHPTLWLRNKARDWAINKIKNTALKLIGEKTTEWAANKLNKANYTLEFEIPIPNKLKKPLLEDLEAHTMLQDAANQVLATPLLALGYTLGTVQCECNNSTLKITIGLELKTTNQITVPVANSK